MADSISFSECQEIIDHFGLKKETFKTFVETGSLNGNTIFAMKNNFDSVHSIELSEHYYNHCSNRFKEDKNVKIHLGDSSVVLPKIIEIIDGDTIFFLDGHWSGGITAKGNKDCPLLEEISSIVDLVKNNCLIIIDDLRLFGTKLNEDWGDITEKNILMKLNDKRFKTTSKNDRFIIFLEKQ